MARRPSFEELVSLATTMSEGTLHLPTSEAWNRIQAAILDAGVPTDLQTGIRDMAWLHRRVHIVNTRRPKVDRAEKKAAWHEALTRELQAIEEGAVP
jgi:hypothetical protein